jgi:hypothetical protein
LRPGCLTESRWAGEARGGPNAQGVQTGGKAIRAVESTRCTPRAGPSARVKDKPAYASRGRGPADTDSVVEAHAAERA